MNWLHYLMEANIYLVVFYLCYCLLLTNETHYNLSRAFLLFGSVISFILPLTRLSILTPTQAVIQQVNFTPGNLSVRFPPPPPPPIPTFTWQDGLVYAYILGAVIALGVFVFRLYQLFKLSHNTKNVADGGYRIIHLTDANTAFSFFNYLFIGTGMAKPDTIITHEMVHIRQKHSWDIMLLELLKIINWFNPFVYLVQRSLKTVHEYIADEQTVIFEQDALTYSSFLLNNAYGIQGSTIAHSFFNYNLLKKRIIMLNKNRSGKLARLKYLAVLPLCGGMLCASTLAFSKNYAFFDLAPKNKPVSKSAASAKKVKRFRINDGGVIAMATDLSDIQKDGTKKFFNASAITAAEISALEKKHHFKIEIVEVDEASNTDPKANTTKAVKPLSVLSSQLAQRANEIILAADTPVTPKKTTKRLPPPPPPPLVKPDKPIKKIVFPPPAVKPGKPVKAPPIAQINRRPPPPPPYNPVYGSLIKHMAKYTRYPTIAYNKQISGHIILSLNINNDHKITDVKVEKGIGYGCDEEAARALKTFNGDIEKAPGNYKIAVTYMLTNNENTRFITPQPLTEKIVGTPNFIGEVTIAGMLNN